MITVKDPPTQKPPGRGRPKQKLAPPPGKRASFPWINSQIIAASESGGVQHLMTVIMAHLPQMNLVNLSTAVHRLAKLSSSDIDSQAHLRVHPGLEELLGTIAASLSMMDSHEAQPQSLSNVAWSLATLRLMHRPLVQVVSALAVSNISCFKPFELSTMLWAFAKLTTVDSSSWCMKPVFQAAATHVMKNIAEFGFRCLATTTWAFATARQRHARLFRCIASQMVPMADVANCQEMANTAWAFGTADFHDDMLFTRLAEKALPRLDEFKPQELSNMLWGFATNGFFHEAFFTHASVVTQHMALEAQHLANILWAFVRVRPRHHVTHATILSLLPSCTRQLHTFKPQEVSSTALAVAKAYCGEVPDDLDVASSTGRPSMLPHASLLHIPHVLLPPQVLDFFMGSMPWALPRLHEFSAQSLANTVSAFSMVRVGGETNLFAAIGHEVRHRYHRLEPISLLHLLKGFSGAPQDICGNETKMLAHGVAHHIDAFRHQELQSLSRICSAMSGQRCSRDLTCEELHSWLLSFAMGEARCTTLMRELTAADHMSMGSRYLADELPRPDDDDRDCEEIQLSNARLKAAFRVFGEDTGGQNPGMPNGALRESDFGSSGPPVIGRPAILPISELVTSQGRLRPQAAPFSMPSTPAPSGRDSSPDNIGCKPKSVSNPVARQPNRREKGSAKGIRNQSLPTLPWVDAEDQHLTTINETYMASAEEMLFAQAGMLPDSLSPQLLGGTHISIVPDFPAPPLLDISTSGMDQMTIPMVSLVQGQVPMVPMVAMVPMEGVMPPDAYSWQCSVKNSFLHFRCRNENGEYMEVEERNCDEDSSHRSSSVPSRFEYEKGAGDDYYEEFELGGAMRASPPDCSPMGATPERYRKGGKGKGYKSSGSGSAKGGGFNNHGGAGGDHSKKGGRGKGNRSLPVTKLPSGC